MNRVSSYSMARVLTRMPMPISAPSSRRTRATVVKGRQSRPKKAIVSDTHISKLARFVFLLSTLAAAVRIQGTVPAVRRVLDAKQEFERVLCPVKLVKSDLVGYEQERIEDLHKPEILEHFLDDMPAL
jgi:hypothetical protein